MNSSTVYRIDAHIVLIMQNMFRFLKALKDYIIEIISRFDRVQQVHVAADQFSFSLRAASNVVRRQHSGSPPFGS